MPSKLILIPHPLSEEEPREDFLSACVMSLIENTRVFMVEEEKSAKRFLKKALPALSLEECAFFILDEHTPLAKAKRFFEEHFKTDIGIISEAGCPCVADPGAEIVRWAHQKDMEVVPLIGPSSIILALMASGLGGQNFAFHGYLPREQSLRREKIKWLQQRSFNEGQTQIFMETPYRNEHLFEDILAVCDPNTALSIAVDLTAPRQYIKTRSIQDWRKQKAPLHKRPAIFCLGRMARNA